MGEDSPIDKTVLVATLGLIKRKRLETTCKALCMLFPAVSVVSAYGCLCLRRSAEGLALAEGFVDGRLDARERVGNHCFAMAVGEKPRLARVVIHQHAIGNQRCAQLAKELRVKAAVGAIVRRRYVAAQQNTEHGGDAAHHVGNAALRQQRARCPP